MDNNVRTIKQLLDPPLPINFIHDHFYQINHIYFVSFQGYIRQFLVRVLRLKQDSGPSEAAKIGAAARLGGRALRPHDQ